MSRDPLRAVLVALLLGGAMVSLGRVFSDTSWVAPSVTAALLAVSLAAGVRALRLGALAATLLSLAGLTVLTYVTHLPPGPLIPGAEQLDQALALFGDGFAAMRDEPAPTPVTAGLLVVVTTAVWLVAHASHELLVRLRHPGWTVVLAGILWGTPLAVPLPPGRTWPQAVPFLVAAGLVLLFESDADVLEEPRQRVVRDTSPAGLLIVALAVTAGAVAPALLPGYQAEAWVEVGGSEDPRGYQPIVDVGDRLKLPADRDVLEVRSDRRSYFRLAALETFDGTTWKIGPAGTSEFRPDPAAVHAVDGGPLPFETEIAEATEVVSEIRVLDLENIYLPVPYQVASIDGESTGDMVYSTQGGFVATAELGENEIAGRLVPGVVEGLTYATVSALPTPTIEQLRESDPRPPADEGLTALPPGTSQRYAGLANEIYAGAGATTAIERVLAVQDFFAGDDRRFTYATDVDALRGEGALERFLFETRTGYCEYFATAMAVLLRSTGIPARVAVGFLGGRLVQPADPGAGRPLDTYRISTSDAHAWVEVLFPGYGWLRFDPTPRADGAVQRPTANDLDPELTEREQAQQDAAPEEAAPTESPSPSPSPSTDADGIPAGIDRGDLGVADGTGSGGTRVRAILLALAALAGSLAAVAAAAWYRRPSHPGLPPAARVLAAQRRLFHVAAGYGIGRRRAETAGEVVTRWAAEGRVDPASAASFTRLAPAAAFGGPLPDRAGADAEALVDRMVHDLRASVDRQQRLLAPLREPASLLVAMARRVGRRLGTTDAG